LSSSRMKRPDRTRERKRGGRLLRSPVSGHGTSCTAPELNANKRKGPANGTLSFAMADRGAATDPAHHLAARRPALSPARPAVEYRAATLGSRSVHHPRHHTKANARHTFDCRSAI
jgi:hypothetical protein